MQSENLKFKKFIITVLKGFSYFGDLSMGKLKIKNLHAGYMTSYRWEILNQDIDNSLKKLEEENEKIKIQ